MGKVGQIQLVQANVRVRSSIDSALEGAHACVNLVGVLYERGRQKFDALHAQAPGEIAQAAAAAGVSRFVQVSAIGAAARSASSYARSKAMGEAGVRAHLPQAVVLRPSVVFGVEDDFFNRFANMAMFSPVLPLIGGGKTRFQPVYVGDVAQAAANALEDDAARGKTYELGGPATYSFRELMALVCKETQRRRALLPIPFPVAAAMGRAGDLQAMLLPVPPPVTSDQVELLRRDNVADPALPGLEALGVTPTAVEAILPTYLWKYRQGGQFAQPQAANA
jgi:NADH dehydrogenase